MKKFLLPACIAAIVSLTSCAGNPPETDANPTTTTDPAVSQPATTQVDSVSAVGTNTIGATGTNTIGSTNPAAAGSQPATQPVTAQPKLSKSTAGLNPAHGQPGHRCDIEVGAPLSSAPATPSQPQMIAPTTPSPAATTNGSVKLNPAHGQPGHDCAVPVGQPLKG